MFEKFVMLFRYFYFVYIPETHKLSVFAGETKASSLSIPSLLQKLFISKIEMLTVNKIEWKSIPCYLVELAADQEWLEQHLYMICWCHLFIVCLYTIFFSFILHKTN